jgi:hypothetical protein
VQDFENVGEENQKAGDKKDQPGARGREKNPCEQETKGQSKDDPYYQYQRAHITLCQVSDSVFFHGLQR